MINKIIETLFPFWFPKNVDKKIESIEKKVNIKGIEKKTKAELEKLGRKIGIELDKRLTKDKLIKAIKKANK